MPALCCLKIAGPLLLSLIAITIAAKAGSRTISPISEIETSSARLQMSEGFMRTILLERSLGVNALAISLDRLDHIR